VLVGAAVARAALVAHAALQRLAVLRVAVALLHAVLERGAVAGAEARFVVLRGLASEGGGGVRIRCWRNEGSELTKYCKTQYTKTQTQTET
jgi:hypothetical protein